MLVVASTVIYMYMDLSRALCPICSASPEPERERVISCLVEPFVAYVQ